MFVLAGNPAEAAHGARYHKDQAETGVWFAAPDNVAFDPQGRIYVLTDQGSAQKRNKIPDGVFVADSEGPSKGLFKLLFACPIDAEMCGGAFTPDGKTLFLAVQHPAEGTNFDNPNTRWPDFKAGMPPRPAVVAVHP
jgi:secreted PhoX family phosphatase